MTPQTTQCHYRTWHHRPHNITTEHTTDHTMSLQNMTHHRPHNITTEHTTDHTTDHTMSLQNMTHHRPHNVTTEHDTPQTTQCHYRTWHTTDHTMSLQNMTHHRPHNIISSSPGSSCDCVAWPGHRPGHHDQQESECEAGRWPRHLSTLQSSTVRPQLSLSQPELRALTAHQGETEDCIIRPGQGKKYRLLPTA